MTPVSPESVVVLLSGGLDSTVALADVLTRHSVAVALTFDYGQRAAQSEITAARAIATHYGVSHEVIALPWYRALLPEWIRAGGTSQASLSEEVVFEVDRVWVPNRNGVLLNIAAAFAEACEATGVVFGANAEEGEVFPDNTPAFREATTTTLGFSTRNGVCVMAPLERLDKTQIVAHGLSLEVPLELVWSCYGAGPRPCGHCASCRRLAKALG